MDTPPGLDVTASRTGERIYLHVVNTERTRAVAAELSIEGRSLASAGAAYEIAVDPTFEVLPDTAEVLAPVRKELPATGRWVFPPASVSAVELALQPSPA